MAEMSDSPTRSPITSPSADDDWIAPPPEDTAAGVDRSIRAPLLAPVLALLAGIAAGELGLSPSVNLAIAVAFSALAIGIGLRLARRAWGFPADGCVLIAAAAIGAARHGQAANPATDHIAHRAGVTSQLVRLEGEVVTPPAVSTPERRNPFLPTEPVERSRFVLSATAVVVGDSPIRCTGLVQVSVEGRCDGLSPGTGVRLTGRLYTPRGPGNPGAVDWRAIQRLSGIHAAMAVDSPALIERSGSTGFWRGCLTRLRAWVRGGLIEPGSRSDGDDATALLDAMVLGQRSVISRQINDAFRRTGAIHYLSVSGFHVGLLALLSWWVAQGVLGRGPRTSAAVTALLVLLYVLVAEPNSPILRAAMMCWLACVAILVGRPLSPMNWLALSAALILLINPLQLFQSGFQFSFVQVAVILLLSPWLARLGRTGRDGTRYEDAHTWPAFVGRWGWSRLRGGLILSAACWGVSIPLSLLHYGTLTPYGAIQSLLIAIPAIVLTMSSFAALLIGLLLPFLQGWTSSGAAWLAERFLAAVEALSSWPGSLIETRPPPVWLVAATYGSLAIGTWMLVKGREHGTDRPAGQPRPGGGIRFGKPAWMVMALPLVGWTAWLFVRPPVPDQTASLDILNVGNGSCALLCLPGSGAAAFDVGSLRNVDVGELLAEACRARSVARLDLAFLSHANTDHYSGLPSLAERIVVRSVVTHRGFAEGRPDTPAVRKLHNLMTDKGIGVGIWHAGDQVPLGECRIECLWPPAEAPDLWDENDRSLVLKLTIGSIRVLLPGDAGERGLSGLIRAHQAGSIDLRAQILIAPHHGAVIEGVTESFMKLVGPEVIIVSAAAPRSRLVDLVGKCFEGKTRVITTGESGAVRAVIRRSGRMEVETPYATGN